MFTVKKVGRGEYVHQIAKAGRITFLSVTPRGWAVVDRNGIPTCRNNEITGKPMFDVFDLKGIAQQQADWMNQNSDLDLLKVNKAD